MGKDISVILHDVRSSENVGSVFRTADAAGASHIYLTGYTPDPVDRFRRPNKKIAKAALGAELSVPWAHRDIHELLAELRSARTRIVAVEQANGSVAYSNYTAYPKTAYILGNEVAGIPSDVLREADDIVEIPMHGKKESLNVAVAAGIILFNTRADL